MKAIIVVGAGGHARSCIEVIESEGIYKIAGLVGLKSEVGEEICGYKVIAFAKSIQGRKGTSVDAKAPV